MAAQRPPSPIIGIDLGTTFSSVGLATPSGVTILQDDAGRVSQPSMVAYHAEGPPMVGHAAMERLITDPDNTIYSFKRLLGKKFDAPVVKIACTGYPYHVVEGPTGQPLIKAAGRRMPVHVIAADLLMHLKAMAEKRIGCELENAVVTVPANADQLQRDATQAACELAHLRVRRFINEPTAAALAFGYGHSVRGTIAIYDFGGGTFDFSILEVEDGVFRVLSTAGDSFLGGDDIDTAMARHISNDYWRNTGIDLTKSHVSWQGLVWACERAKRELSFQPTSRLYVENVALRATGPVHLDYTISRQDLESVAQEIVGRTLTICDEALQAASLATGQVQSVVLVGGTTLMPMVRNAVMQHFQLVPDTRMDPLTAVAAGAAIHAMTLKSTVAVPAASPAPLLLDVTSHSVGIATAGIPYQRVLHKNMPVPAENTVSLATWMDSQTEMVIHVYQGEHDNTTANVQVGEVTIRDLPAAPAGQLCVEVTVEVDTDGRVKLTVRQSDTGRVQVARWALVSDAADARGRA